MAFEIKGFGEPSKFNLKFKNFNNSPKKKVYIQEESDGYQLESEVKFL